MKENLKVVCVQAETYSVYEKERNIQYHVDKILSLKDEHPDLVVFPELSISGYIRESNPENRRDYWNLGAEPVPGPATNRIIEAAKEVGCYVIFGIAERTPATMVPYNSAVLVGPEGFVGVARKIHLPLIEKDYFIQGTQPKVYNTSIGKIGMIICYELFFPESSRMIAINGAEICVFIGFVAVRDAKETAEGKGGGVGIGEEKQYLFNTAPRIRALENQMCFVACTAGGKHDMGGNTGLWQRAGHSKIINNFGDIIAESNLDSEDLVIGTLKASDLRLGRAAYPMLKDRRPWMYGCFLKKDL